MESVKFDRERGQILVQVAIMVGVLFAFAALAVDAGNVYGGRRRMQNAADAGALAGARAICFPEGVDPEDEAYDYAERNGARPEDVEVTIEDYTVIVTAAQTLDTFFAGVIGINEADVRAEAAAACGGTVSGRGLWPLAFKYDVYSDTIPCGEKFRVFSSGSVSGPGPLECAPDFCYDEDGNELTQDDLTTEEYEACDGTYNCEGIGFHFATDERGWLQLPDTGEDYPCKNYNCGADSVACYLEFDYPGLIEAGNCVPGKSGVAAAMKNPVEAREEDIVQIILWELPEEPCTPEGILASCSEGNDPYFIKDFGCVQVIQWEQQYGLSSWQNTGNPQVKRLMVIEARKICNDTMGTIDPLDRTVSIHEDGEDNIYDALCSSQNGSSSGMPPEEWETRSVSLIQWPRP